MARIIIIDDDPDILEASSLVLKAKGYEVLTAQNPDDGFELVKQNSPDLIILDVIMVEPDDGFFLAQKLRKAGFTNPIIMYTSVSKSTGFKFGAGELVPVDDFIEKPISPEQLIAKVEKFINVKKEK